MLPQSSPPPHQSRRTGVSHSSPPASAAPAVSPPGGSKKTNLPSQRISQSVSVRAINIVQTRPTMSTIHAKAEQLLTETHNSELTVKHEARLRKKIGLGTFGNLNQPLHCNSFNLIEKNSKLSIWVKLTSLSLKIFIQFDLAFFSLSLN